MRAAPPPAEPLRPAARAPEPGSLWIRYAPRGWPAPGGWWLDLARGELVAPMGEGEAAAEPPAALPELAGGPFDDVVWLPPVPPALRAARDRLAERLLAAGTPVLVQALPGEEVGPEAATVVVDLTASLLAAAGVERREGGNGEPLDEGSGGGRDAGGGEAATGRIAGSEAGPMGEPERGSAERAATHHAGGGTAAGTIRGAARAGDSARPVAGSADVADWLPSSAAEAPGVITMPEVPAATGSGGAVRTTRLPAATGEAAAGCSAAAPAAALAAVSGNVAACDGTSPSTDDAPGPASTARSGGRPVGEPTAVADRSAAAGASVSPLVDPFSSGSPEPLGQALAHRPAGAAAVWPLIPGVTDRPDLVAAGLDALAAAGVAAVQPLAPRLAPADRRRLAEEAGGDAFDRLFHGGEPDERAFARAAAARGLAFLVPRPLPRPPLAGAANRRIAADLAVAGELWLRLGRAPSQAQAYFRAARWADETGYDLPALAREGNLGVVAALDAASRELIEEAAASGREPSRIAELRAAYLAEEGA